MIQYEITVGMEHQQQQQIIATSVQIQINGMNLKSMEKKNEYSQQTQKRKQLI